MNIFVDAFIDVNFGDNFFVHTIVKRYPKHDFYLVEKEGYETSYQILQKHENNVHIISPKDEQVFFETADAMMIVGGDIFWDYGDYSVFLKKMRAIKEKNGWTAILGISLFERYSEKTQDDFREMFSLADVIVVRDKETFIQLKKLVLDANVILSTDMAFTYDAENIRQMEPQKGVLGVSVRKKIPRNTEDKYIQYCDGIAETVEEYLKESEKNSVTFLALSAGTFSDMTVVEEIINLCPEEYRSRMRYVSFKGDIDAYISEMQKCERMLCTRYHSLVFAMILKKPFVPIIYEEKMRRLLKEIAYYGLNLNYEDELEPKRILEALKETHYSETELSWYLSKSERFFEQIDGWLIIPKNKRGLIQKIKEIL